MSEFPAQGLQQLAEQILTGQNVFFIGAGFSLDSEGNSATRLVAKLLLRFDAATTILSQSADNDKQHIARELRQRFCHVFDIKDTGELFDQGNAKKLACSYYKYNDWICSAFTALFRLFGQNEKNATVKPRQLLYAIRKQEKSSCKRINTDILKTGNCPCPTFIA